MRGPRDRRSGQHVVAGFDHIDLAAEISPPGTTVRVVTAQIRRRAAERLLARLNGEPVPRIEELSRDVVVRGSTAPPTALARDVKRKRRRHS